MRLPLPKFWTMRERLGTLDDSNKLDHAEGMMPHRVGRELLMTLMMAVN
jgi:hypothetical protein